MLLIVRAAELLDRHPAVQRTIRLRNPYVDPINAIQVELLREWRDPALDDAASRGAAPAARTLHRRRRRRPAQHGLRAPPTG